jgi:hypothetical protein
MIYDVGNPRPGLGQAQRWSIVQASDSIVSPLG